MPRLLSASPYLLVRDVALSAEHYRDVLGFQFERLFGQPPSFVMLERDGVEIMLAQPGSGELPRPHRALGRLMLDVYIRVDDVDALHAELIERGARVVCAPVTREHGMREIEVEDPDGHILCFAADVA